MILENEKNLRINKIADLLKGKNIDAIIICSNVNLFYITGFIYSGYAIIDKNGKHILLSKNNEPTTTTFQKPAEIINVAKENGILINKNICFDDEHMTASDFLYLSNCFKSYNIITNTKILRLSRMIKTTFEIEQIKESAIKNDIVYNKIPELYKNGMTDIEFGLEIEHFSRQNGHLGLFRSFGGKMECFMGSLLAGDNSSTPSPFDFALGGKGAHCSLPIGASGSKILPNQSIMVDYSGNANGYLSDMSRTFYTGSLPEIAYNAHKASEEIHDKCCEHMKNKDTVCLLWQTALEIAKDYNLSEYFMGSEKQAKFVGHGLGIEINELPVLTQRDETKLSVGMVIALEPKFAIPGVGAIGNEDTYEITENGYNRLTNASRELINITKASY